MKAASDLLKKSGLNFAGNVEGSDIYIGQTDVIVCDGFVGNVALKTSEGLTQMLAQYLKEEFNKGYLNRFAGLMALPVIKQFRRRVDHRRYNGASLLGLKGIVVKSHGAADSFSFEFALEKAVGEVKNNMLDEIAARMSEINEDVLLKMYSRIISTGSYLPEKRLTNFDFEQMLDTSNSWIVERSGIESRRVAGADELASDLGYKAAYSALKRANLEPNDVDLIIVATTTPDMIFPSTACIVQSKLGVKDCIAFDVQAVCSGFVYGLNIADLFIKSGQAKTALVIGSEVYSRILDYNDRGTCVLFGDGAGAAIVANSKSRTYGSETSC